MNRRTLVAAAIGIVVLAVGVGWLLLRDRSPVDAALDEVRRLPLVGPVMAENPAIESRMRAAIEEEIRSPTQSGPSRPFLLVADIRRQYIVPALRAADDATAVAAVAARADLVRHLRRADTAACRQFALGAFQRPDLLDAEGQRLFGEVLQKLEAAWRSGKAGKPQPVMTREELMAALGQAGFGKADFDRLNGFQSLSNDLTCDVELKIDSAAPLLPADKRGPFARAILGT